MTVERLHGFECPECRFALWWPVARLSCSVIGLYDDRRFPGRCLLALDRHVEDSALEDA